jgi:hypothetical protein
MLFAMYSNESEMNAARRWPAQVTRHRKDVLDRDRLKGSETGSGEGRRRTVDKVAGFLEVGRTDDTHDVVISYSNPKLDANGTVRIVFSPRYARHLANLLTEHATYAEAETVGVPLKTRPYRPGNRDKRSSQSK